MTYDVTDTIAAIASPEGPAARGIVRIAGPETLRILRGTFRSDEGIGFQTDAARRYVGAVRLDHLGRDLPGALLLWPTSRSYTRQPQAEFHTLGSAPLLKATLNTFLARGARLAQPGEFTLRAFLAGRLDLTQAEAVLGLIQARSPEEVRVGLSQMAGGLLDPLTRLRNELLDLLADLEAGLDFADEDLEFVAAPEVARRLDDAVRLIEGIESQIEGRFTQGEVPRIVLTGPPNVGKSSLFNSLIGRAAAIVADVPGTTRDYLAAVIEWKGARFELIDTAGTTEDFQCRIDTAAQEKSVAMRSFADIRLDCREVSTRPNGEANLGHREANIMVWTKCDRIPIQPPRTTSSGEVFTSSTQGHGREQLLDKIVERLSELEWGSSTMLKTTAVRAQASLAAASLALREARQYAAINQGQEFVAEELRHAVHSLGEVTGAVYTEDILDRVFSRFCIGK
jgi:tRNA modification GTPase